MSKPKGLAIDRDIYKQQSDLITDLREQLEQRDQRIEYLEGVAAEHKELMEAFGNNGQITYNQAMQSILTRRNAAVQAQRDRINYERQSQRDAVTAAKHDAEVKQVLADNPNLQKYCEERKAKIQQTRDNMLKLAEEFYELDGDAIRQYISIGHGPEESAVKHMINEITERNDVTGAKGSLVYYDCDYCGDTKYSSLADVERHCWNEGEDHRDANLSRIKAETIHDISKANVELTNDIDNAIRGKKDAEYKHS